MTLEMVVMFIDTKMRDSMSPCGKLEKVKTRIKSDFEHDDSYSSVGEMEGCVVVSVLTMIRIGLP